MQFVVRKNRSRLDPPATLNEWMERTGTTGNRLIELLKAEGYSLSRGHLSNILKGSRRCSLRTAIALHEITGVSIKSIARWPSLRDDRTRETLSSSSAA
jgi:transcriptional regulator with XRE-family HTH domain